MKKGQFLLPSFFNISNEIVHWLLKFNSDLFANHKMKIRVTISKGEVMEGEELNGQA